ITSATRARADTMFSSYARSDLVVQTAPFGYYPWSQALPVSYVDRIAQLPSVRAVVADRFLLVEHDHQPTLVAALGRGSSDPIAALAGRVARRTLERGGSAIVTRRFATTQHVGVHQLVRLPTPAGTRLVRIAAVIVTLVVFDAFALSLVHRRRELAVLRAIGARRSHVLGMVVTEALLTGAIAVVLGAVLGLALVHEGAMLSARVVGFRIAD